MDSLMRSLIVPCLFFWISLIEGQNDQQLPTKWKVYEYPNPRFQPKRCGRVKESLICDPNGIISEQDANDIETLLRRIYSETRCDCQKCQIDETGYAVMVAIMPRMDRLMVNASQNPIEDVLYNAKAYAYYLSLYWGFTDCDERVIILYCRDDDVLYTLTYKDARKYLTDNVVIDSTLRATKHFKSGTKEGIAKGLKQLVQMYFGKLQEKTQ